MVDMSVICWVLVRVRAISGDKISIELKFNHIILHCHLKLLASVAAVSTVHFANQISKCSKRKANLEINLISSFVSNRFSNSILNLVVYVFIYRRVRPAILLNYFLSQLSKKFPS